MAGASQELVPSRLAATESWRVYLEAFIQRIGWFACFELQSPHGTGKAGCLQMELEVVKVKTTSFQ